MNREPAKTLALAALRELDSEKQRRLEDRCTEMLAFLIFNYHEVLDAVTDLFDIDRPATGVLEPRTQVETGRGREHVDLEISAIDESYVRKAIAWVEVKVFSKESGPDQFMNYANEALINDVSFHVLCHDRYRGELAARHPGLRIKTWEDLSSRLRDIAGLGSGSLPEEIDRDSPQATLDIWQFLYYLQLEGVVHVSESVTEDDLGRFHRWQDGLRRVYDLWVRTFDAVEQNLFRESTWSHERITPKRNSPFNPRQISDRSRPDEWSEWWWGVFRPVGTQTWGVELSLASREWWNDDAGGHPVLVWGITQHTLDAKLEEQLEAIAKKFDELEPAHAYGDDDRRWYAAISLGDVLGMEPDQQLAHLVSELGDDRILKLRDELIDGGLVDVTI